MEGVITILSGIAGYFLIVDFPELAAKSWAFLTPAESEFVVARIEKDRHDAFVEPFHIGNYLKNALDLKIWGFAWLFMLATTNSYAIAYFLPIILRSGMGFDIARAQCLNAPPYVAAAIVMYAQAVYADKWHLRGPVVIINAILGLIGLPLLGFATNNGVRYFGAFLATICGNANVPAVLTYQANNIRGQWKRAFCSATLVGFGGIGGIIGSTIFREADSPNYRPGIMGTMIANGLSILIVLALTLKFWRANKRAAEGGRIIEGQQGFRYTL
jgi:MFS family permease